MKNPCVFLDRDGVINVDCVNYTYKVEDFELIEGVLETLKRLKDAGYLLIVITNQSGIVKGIYDHSDVQKCHDFLQEKAGHLIDHFYYSPYHEKWTSSLSRKPGTLMFEKAIARYDVDIARSWMVGDKERDLLPAKKMGLKTILLPEDGKGSPSADHVKKDLREAGELILSMKSVQPN